MLINKDKHKIKTVRINNGKWEEEYKVKLKESLTKENEMHISTYNQLEMCIKKAASLVIQKMELTNEMIKEGKEELKGILLKLFNEMLQNNEKVPKQWKLGDIISIYKGKGERTEMKYKRGLSLTSCVLKCLEKIIANSIDP